jgi:hypothetical protein
LDAIDAPTSPGWLRQIPAVQVLHRAWAEQYHRDEEGVRRRDGKDLPPGRDRLSSPYDTDARYGLKRGQGWVGFKIRLSETWEPDRPHLSTQVATTDATVTDTEMTEAIRQGLAHRGLTPGEHAVDAGYVTAAHLLTARDAHGIDLVGPVGADTCHGGRDAQGVDLAQGAFCVDWQRRTLTCPRGATSIVWSGQRKRRGTRLPGCTSPPPTVIRARCAGCAPRRPTAGTAAV